MNGQYPKISVKKGREYQILRGHPWLFSGGISQAPTKLEPGGLVDLVDTQGRFVARGYYNPNTDIAVRVLTRSADDDIDEEFLRLRIAAAAEMRRNALDTNATDAYRLINAEGDFLPGFIVDNYAGNLVVQSHTAGADRILEPFLKALEETTKPKSIVLRNDSGGRKREGLETAAPKVVRGNLDGEIIVRENNFKFGVDVLGGQKTGFFTDQREKRVALARYCARLPEKARMVNGFCYTGAFSVYATSAKPTLRTVNIDESHRALEQAGKNFELNSMNLSNHELVSMDAFTWLDQQKAADERFDLVLLDPPAFAKSHKDKQRAMKGYFRMNRLGISITKPGGFYITCSCSGSVTLEEFSATLRDAAAEEFREVQVLEVFLNGLDHPVNVAAPEGNYLKVLFCRVN
jgi:23S rRNA (cytosine1962-C5)-methyltransferase